MDNFKDWPKIFPEHYYKNAKASVERQRRMEIDEFNKALVSTHVLPALTDLLIF